MTKFKKGDFSEDAISKEANKKGFSLESVEYHSNKPYLHLVCEAGHKKAGDIYILSSRDMTCQICNGKRYDYNKLKNLLSNRGYTLLEEPKLDEDMYGNKIIKAGTRIKASCPYGHKQSFAITEFTNRECTQCSKTMYNSGFSRSEEIIDRILAYNGIHFDRQYGTGDMFENLALDFMLPNHKIIIEYDGAHHKYGRSDSTEEQLAEIIRKDNVRDAFAEHFGYTMIRIGYTINGKMLVYELAERLEGIVDIKLADPHYDTIIKEVFDECATRFGWVTYDKVKQDADVYLNNSLSTASKLTGLSQSVLARRFRWIYGMGKEDYIKFKRVGRDRDSFYSG